MRAFSRRRYSTIESHGESSQSISDKWWKWRKFFKNPSLWWDYRQCKKEANAPDFVHESTGETLLIDASSCPGWLGLKLASLEKFAGSGGRARYKNVEEQRSFAVGGNSNNQSSSPATIASKLEGRDALELYQRIRRHGDVPPLSVSLAALKSCIGNKDLETGRKIHLEIATESRDRLHSHIANTLIEMYAKCGSMPEARRIFDEIKHRSIVSWNSIIKGYASNGDGAEAIELFSRMQEQGFDPDSRIFIAAIKACSDIAAREESIQVGDKMVKIESLNRGRRIHRDLSERGYGTDLYVASTLVDFYAKCGSMIDARRVFDEMDRYDVVSWTAMILGYAASGDGDLGLEFFVRMQREGFRPDSRIFVAAIKACGSAAARSEGIESKRIWLEKGIDLHDQAARSGYEYNVYVAVSLVDMYAKCGSLEKSRLVFDRSRHRIRSVVLWNSIIAAYAQNGSEESALDLFRSMKSQGFDPDARTTAVAIAACTALAGKEDGIESGGSIVKVASLDRGRALHSEAIKIDHHRDVFVASSLVDFYAKCGSMIDARRVFDGMDRRSSAAWQAIISGYAHCGEEALAMELFDRMKSESRDGGGVAVGSRHYIAAFKACGGLADLETGRNIHRDIREAGFEDEVLVTNALVHFYGKCGSMDLAREVFDKARSKSLVTWNALIAGYTHQGDSAMAFEIFEKMTAMEPDRVSPSEITYLHILNACTHAGLVEKGREVFQAMRSRFDPGLEHYTCMIDLLGRANHLDEALAMAGNMPCKPDTTVWRALLGACQKWGNPRVGKVAFDRLMELDEGDATAYVLMANIYAGSKMWKESAEIQSLRRS